MYCVAFGLVAISCYFLLDNAYAENFQVTIVNRGGPSHPELQWVNGSLTVTRDNATNSVIVSKQIQNTGGSDANSILFRLKIRNQTGFLFYDHYTTANVQAKQNMPIGFIWDNPPVGNYQLNLEANAANTIGDTNANNDVSMDVISIPNYTKNKQNFLSGNNFTLNKEEKTIPEFGPMSYIVLVLSALSIVILSSKSILRSKV